MQDPTTYPVRFGPDALSTVKRAEHDARMAELSAIADVALVETLQRAFKSGAVHGLARRRKPDHPVPYFPEVHNV